MPILTAPSVLDTPLDIIKKLKLKSKTLFIPLILPPIYPYITTINEELNRKVNFYLIIGVKVLNNHHHFQFLTNLVFASHAQHNLHNGDQSGILILQDKNCNYHQQYCLKELKVLYLTFF